MYQVGDEVWSNYYGYGIIKEIKRSKIVGEENIDLFKIHFPDRGVGSKVFPDGWSATLYEEAFVKFTNQVRGTELQAKKKGVSMGIAVPKPGTKVKSAKAPKPAKEKVVKKAAEPKVVDPNLLTLEAAEKEFGKPLYSAIRTKALPATKQGRAWMVERADVKAYLSTQAA